MTHGEVIGIVIAVFVIVSVIVAAAFILIDKDRFWYFEDVELDASEK